MQLFLFAKAQEINALFLTKENNKLIYRNLDRSLELPEII